MTGRGSNRRRASLDRPWDVSSFGLIPGAFTLYGISRTLREKTTFVAMFQRHGFQTSALFKRSRVSQGHRPEIAPLSRCAFSYMNDH